MRIEIGSNEAGQRLDKFLRKLLKDVPLSAIFKALRKGDIRVNGKKEKEKYSLQEGDLVEIKYIQSKREVKENFIQVNSSGLKIIYEDKGIGFDKEAIALRNVSGEVLGAKMAVEFAINNNYKEVTIAYDYQGIESWALGTWKRNNKITSEYNEYMQNKMKEINIRFKKIKGHSGHKYNDLADKLAKEALGIK